MSFFAGLYFAYFPFFGSSPRCHFKNLGFYFEANKLLHCIQIISTDYFFIIFFTYDITNKLKVQWKKKTSSYSNKKWHEKIKDTLIQVHFHVLFNDLYVYEVKLYIYFIFLCPATPSRSTESKKRRNIRMLDFYFSKALSNS